ILEHPLSEEEALRLETLKKTAKQRCREELQRRFRDRQKKIAADAESGNLREVWRLAKPRRRVKPGLGPITNSDGELQTAEDDIDRTWALYWAELYKDKDGLSKNRSFWEGSKLNVKPVSGE
ncbi:MAG: uncharacterized protein A8A55_3637, partial [Amphiamblys sp. WSBS2006]